MTGHFTDEDIQIAYKHIILFLSISPFRSINNYFIYVGTPRYSEVGSYILIIVMSYFLLCILMNCPLYHYIMSIFVSCYLFWLEACFFCCEFGYSCFCWLPFAWNIIFHPFTLSLLVCRAEVSLLEAAYSWVLHFNSPSHSVTFDWWIQSIYI